MSTSTRPRYLRVGHSIVKAGSDLRELAGRLDGAEWDMVELDVLAADGELIVAHDARDLAVPRRLPFGETLAELRSVLPPATRINVDVKAGGYETHVLEAITESGLRDRVLVSTMELESLRILRAHAPDLKLGLSVPRVSRDPFAHPLTRPAAYAMLVYLRQVLPGRMARLLARGEIDAVMAHWRVVTPRLVRAVAGNGPGELFVWTVDHAERVRALEPLGVTGIITNDRSVFDAPR